MLSGYGFPSSLNLSIVVDQPMTFSCTSWITSLINLHSRMHRGIGYFWPYLFSDTPCQAVPKNGCCLGSDSIDRVFFLRLNLWQSALGSLPKFHHTRLSDSGSHFPNLVSLNSKLSLSAYLACETADLSIQMLLLSLWTTPCAGSLPGHYGIISSIDISLTLTGFRLFIHQ